MTGLLGSIDHEMPATETSKHRGYKGITLATHVLIRTKNRCVTEITGSTRLILTGAREHAAF